MRSRDPRELLRLPFVERIAIVAWVEMRLYDVLGRLVDVRILPNLITNVGLAQVAGLINGVVTTPFKYVAVGDGSATSPGTCTAPSPTDTALGREVMRVQATVGRTTTSVTNDTATLDATFNFTSSYALCEAGIFDAPTGGNMLSRLTFPVLNVVSGDTLEIKWRIRVVRV
jgi:hypothetical protein